ncbi:MAG: alpha/beta hydrolase [Ornithinimicrobium sp.]
MTTILDNGRVPTGKQDPEAHLQRLEAKLGPEDRAAAPMPTNCREGGGAVARRRRVHVIVALTITLVVVGALAAGVWWGQRSLIYFPDTAAPPPVGDVLPSARDVGLTTGDGLELTARYVEAPAPEAATVLVLPGNGGNRGDRSALASGLAQQGLGVLLVDYRGYGGNPGSPSQDGLALDARAARSFLVGEADVDPGLLIYLGESLGAAVATELATDHPPAALVLRSPFSTLAAAGQANYGVPLGWLLRDDYPVAELVRRVEAPVWVVYGNEDSIVPAHQSIEVAKAAQAVEAIEVAGADHNDAELTHGRKLLNAVSEASERTAYREPEADPGVLVRP